MPQRRSSPAESTAVALTASARPLSRRCGMRRLLGGVLAAVAGSSGVRVGGIGALAMVTARPLAAHHGMSAQYYDLVHPLFMAAVVRRTYFGAPHGRLDLMVDRDQRRPRDTEVFRPLEDAEQRLTMDRLVHCGCGGRLSVVLPPDLSRDLRDQPWLLAEGDRIELVVYRRIRADEYRHELLAAAMRLADGRLTVSMLTPATRLARMRAAQGG